MRSCMCFSALQNPRCRMRLVNGYSVFQPKSYPSIWFDSFPSIGSIRRKNDLKPVGAKANKHFSEEYEQGLRDENTKNLSGRLKWVNETERLSGKFKQQQITTDVYTRKNNTQSTKAGNVRPGELLDGAVTTNTTEVHVNKSVVNEIEAVDCCDVEQETASRECQPLVTVFIFDLETTGLNRGNDRIIEIAVRDVNGGENSTFEALVNPECDVSNSHIHGISTHMVNRPNVPRFKDVAPILRHFIRSRQIPNSQILLVSHNARGFDVPFLINEFSRCSEEIPPDWMFLDTLTLAREVAKLESAKNLSGKSVQALREHYGIPLVGKAHRAMSDVNSLAMILGEMTMDLKLPASGLLERSFKASDIGSGNKKKKSGS